MSSRNPSLTLTQQQVDNCVDALLAGRYVDQRVVFNMNMSRSETVTAYVAERYNYSQRNHITRRSNTISKKILDCLRDYKSSDSLVYLVSAEKTYYEKYKLGYVVAESSAAAIAAGNIIYSHALGEFRSDFRMTATLVGPGQWVNAEKMNLELVSDVNKQITELVKQMKTYQNKIDTLSAVSLGYTQNLTGG